MAGPQKPIVEIVNEIVSDLGSDAVKYVQFRSLVERMHEESKDGSMAAFEVLDIVRRFHRLVKYSQQE